MGAGTRPQMSVHSTQTDSGITPLRTSSAKALQPRQSPRNDSSPAATTSIPTSTYAAPAWPNPYARTTAVTVSTAPIPCANRLGGPETGFSTNGSRGTRPRVTSWPSGLSVGPVQTRATKP